MYISQLSNRARDLVGPERFVCLSSKGCGETVLLLRPNKKISVFGVTGLKILGRVGTHMFFIIFFFWENI